VLPVALLVILSNPLPLVRDLAAREDACEFYAPVLASLRQHGLDTDDLREIIRSELGDAHCFRTKPTEKYFPATMSDYYAIWVDDCWAQMFIKLLVVSTPQARLVVTSFKRDERI
jgi:hypothetical protein